MPNFALLNTPGALLRKVPPLLRITFVCPLQSGFSFCSPFFRNSACSNLDESHGLKPAMRVSERVRPHRILTFQLWADEPWWLKARPLARLVFNFDNNDLALTREDILEFWVKISGLSLSLPPSLPIFQKTLELFMKELILMFCNHNFLKKIISFFAFNV